MSLSISSQGQAPAARDNSTSESASCGYASIHQTQEEIVVRTRDPITATSASTTTYDGLVPVRCVHKTQITLKAAKWDELHEDTKATLISNLEVRPDPTIKARVMYRYKFYVEMPGASPKDIPVFLGTSLTYLMLKPSKGLVGFPDVSQDNFKEHILVKGLKKSDPRYKTYYEPDDHDRRGVPAELLACFTELFYHRGVMKKPSAAAMAWPCQDDVLFFIQKIQIKPKFSGKSLVGPILDHIFSCVGSCAMLPAPYKIAGDISWILEPGFIGNDESSQTWRDAGIWKDNAEYQDNVNEVVKRLIGLYEHLGFRIAVDKPKGVHFVATYLAQRTRATTQPEEPVQRLPHLPEEGKPKTIAFKITAAPKSTSSRITSPKKRKADDDDDEYNPALSPCRPKPAKATNLKKGNEKKPDVKRRKPIQPSPDATAESEPLASITCRMAPSSSGASTGVRATRAAVAEGRAEEPAVDLAEPWDWKSNKPWTMSGSKLRRPSQSVK
ncbi:unnamed protein product [Discula destructiva]